MINNNSAKVLKYNLHMMYIDRGGYRILLRGGDKTGAKRPKIFLSPPERILSSP